MRAFLICEFLLAVSLSGQLPDDGNPRPSFEVAVIKPWKPMPRSETDPAPRKVDPGRRTDGVTSDRVHFIGQIELFIMDAYDLPLGSERRILNNPKWVNDEADRYEITAKIDAQGFAKLRQVPADDQRREVRQMEQTLLAERFRLRLHMENRGRTPVFALVVAQGGPKLTRSAEGEVPSLSLQRNEITAKGVTLDQFASSPLWTPIGNRYVVNQTGLTERYDFKLKWRPDRGDPDEASTGEHDDDLPALFDAIREQLGLKVIDSSGPLKVIVIDHIERPTRN